MAVFFFDTSALVKRYYSQKGTDAVDEIIETDQNRVVISSLSIIETVSPFRRKHNRGELSKEAMDGLLSSFFQEALEEFLILPLEESILQFSFELILEDDLRTLDSLQLSAAISIEPEIEDFRFVCADSDLVSIAQKRGLSTVNLVEEQ